MLEKLNVFGMCCTDWLARGGGNWKSGVREFRLDDNSGGNDLAGDGVLN